MAHPGGNLALARAYLRKAGYRSGRYTGGRRLLVVGTNSEPGRFVALSARRQLKRLGFRLRFKLVDQDKLYTDYCGVPRARVAVCANVGWFKDFLDPESMLRPIFSGDLITPEFNSNWSLLDVPRINAAIDAARRIYGPGRPATWANVNRMVIGQAATIPYVWDQNYAVQSKDVDGAMNPYTPTWDLSFTSLR